MVEFNSLNEVASGNLHRVTDDEHGKALQALQSEIEYHRKVVANNTYVENIVSYVYDGGRSESLHKLEVAYEQETQKPNSESRQELTKLLADDRRTLYSHMHIASALGAIESGLAIFGGSRGKFIATGLITLSTMHPNDSFGKQALEAVAGIGLGSAAAWGFNKGGAMKNQILGVGLLASAYPVASQMTRIQWPNGGDGEAPDIDKIYGSNLSSRIDSSSLRQPNQQPRTRIEPAKTLDVPVDLNNSTSEWSQFSLLKKQ